MSTSLATTKKEVEATIASITNEELTKRDNSLFNQMQKEIRNEVTQLREAHDKRKHTFVAIQKSIQAHAASMLAGKTLADNGKKVQDLIGVLRPYLENGTLSQDLGRKILAAMFKQPYQFFRSVDVILRIYLSQFGAAEHGIFDETALDRLSDFIVARRKYLKEDQAELSKDRKELEDILLPLPKDLQDSVRAFLKILDDKVSSMTRLIQKKLQKNWKEYYDRTCEYLPTFISLQNVFHFGVEESDEVETAIKAYSERVDKELACNLSELQKKLEALFPKEAGDYVRDVTQKIRLKAEESSLYYRHGGKDISESILNAMSRRRRTLFNFSTECRNETGIRLTFKAINRAIEICRHYWDSNSIRPSSEEMRDSILAVMNSPRSHAEVVAEDNKRKKEIEAVRREASKEAEEKRVKAESDRARKLEEERKTKAAIENYQKRFADIVAEFDPNEKSLLLDISVNNKKLTEDQVLPLLQKLRFAVTPTANGSMVKLGSLTASYHRGHDGRRELDPAFIAKIKKHLATYGVDGAMIAEHATNRRRNLLTFGTT